MTIRKIDLMHRVFGAQGDGYYCRDCYHLCSYEANRKWYKCEVYGITQSEASDWRLGYPACRQYNKKWDGNPIIRLVRPGAAPDTPIAGQMALTDSPFIYAEYFAPAKEELENARTVTDCVFPTNDSIGGLK